ALSASSFSFPSSLSNSGPVWHRRRGALWPPSTQRATEEPMYRDTVQPHVRRLAAELYADRHDNLLAIARRNAHTEADATEALQEASASFIAKFDPKCGAPPLAWLTLTLKRQCWRQRREAHLDRQVGQEARRGGEELGSFLEAVHSHEPDPAERLIER